MCDFVCDGGICLPVFATDGVCVCVVCLCVPARTCCAGLQTNSAAANYSDRKISLRRFSHQYAPPFSPPTVLLQRCYDASGLSLQHFTFHSVFLWPVLLRQSSAPVWTEIPPSAVHCCFFEFICKELKIHAWKPLKGEKVECLR